MNKVIFATYQLGSANKESVIEIPVGAYRLQIQCRTAHAMKVSDISGRAGSSENPYWTIKSGHVHVEDIEQITEPITLHVCSATASREAEIIMWIKDLEEKKNG